MGEQSVTFGDKEALEACLEQRSEVGSALAKLQSLRQQASASLLEQKPVTIKKGKLLSGMQRS